MKIIALTIIAASLTLTASTFAGGYGRSATGYANITRGATSYAAIPRATFAKPAYPYHGAASLRSAYSQPVIRAVPRTSYRPTLSSRYSTRLSRYKAARR
ncbi:MAG: hypothetical protein AAGD22_18515 [Verrucomicrobiota bacterium]